MNVTFEQARVILEEDLDIEGDSRRVAAWGWENDEIFVLAIETTPGGSSAEESDDDEDEDDNEDVRGYEDYRSYDEDDEDGDDDWGTPEDLQAVVEHVRLAPRGWNPWGGQPDEVPVVEKATGRLRWVAPAGLGEPVAPNLRPIGEVPAGQRWRDRKGIVLTLDELRDIWADAIASLRSYRAQTDQDGMSDEEFEDQYSFGSWLYQQLLNGYYDPVEDDGDEDLPAT